MKSLAIITGAFILLAITTISVLADPAPGSVEQVNARQETQMGHIMEGRKTGTLSKKEQKKLLKHQEKIADKQRAYLKDDGHLSKNEQKKLNKLQDKASEKTTKYNHNNKFGKL